MNRLFDLASQAYIAYIFVFLVKIITLPKCVNSPVSYGSHIRKLISTRLCQLITKLVTPPSGNKCFDETHAIYLEYIHKHTTPTVAHLAMLYMCGTLGHDIHM